MQAKFNMLITILTVLASLTACQTTKFEPIPGDTIGIVLMHGKGGTHKYISGLAYNLKSASILVKTPLMPWSNNRIYDKSYEESMEEIDTHVASLKNAGAKRIVIAGHSLGANVALGYAARRENLTGVILMAYGHVPGNRWFAQKLARSVVKADAMIEAGKGESTATFMDYDGETFSVSGTANDILSWFDPVGPAVIRFNAPGVKPNTPVLCIEGKYAKFENCNRGNITTLLPNNPNNHYALVNADHLSTPQASFKEIIDWLRKL